MPRLLVIDDRDQTVEMVHRRLPQLETVTRCDRRVPCQVCEERERGCPLRCAHDWGEAAEALGRARALPDLVVLDLHFARPEERLLPEDKSQLPGEPKARAAALEALRRRQGLLILERLRQTYPTLPVVMLTTTGSDLGAARPDDPLVYLCENEVVDSRTLAAEISRALALGHRAQEGPVFWGRTRAMTDLARQLEVLARSPLPVLVEGETGTGKSFLAEHVIHARSGAKGPLVVTDLSTIPGALLAAHLFGARRGAYTGAVEDHAGVFEQAHGGTLFLDEIANLDLDLQRQLLLVLERGTVTRLGDARARPASPKLVAATNEDVEALVREGRFRADLYMRLNPAARLRVPPLRERTADLPDLVRFAFLEALRGEALRPLVRAYLASFPTPEDFDEAASTVTFGRPRAEAARRDAFSVFVSKEAMERLAAHDWPGNHRELRLFATNALVFCLTQHLDAGAADEPAARAPAILPVPDPLVARLLGAVTGGRPKAAARGRAGGEAHRDRAARGGHVRARVRRRREAVPARALRRVRGRPRAHGARAARSARHGPAGPPALEPARPAPARAARDGAMMTAGGLVLLALLLGAPDAGAPEGGATPTPVAGEGGAEARGEGASPPASTAATRATARADHALGLARLRAGRAAEAADLFARAVAGDPANAALLTDLGFALGKQGRRAEAEAALRVAIEKDPRRFYAYVNLADLLADDPARWDRQGAIVADLEKGLAALKDDRKGRFNLLLRVANFERAVGRTAAARARMEPLLASDAAPALTPAQRKRVLDQLDAITLDERAHALEPWPSPVVGADETARADAAAAALAAGRAEDALSAVDPLARARPTWQRARFLRGRALESLGRVDEAARELETAVNLAPSDAEAWRALGSLLAREGGALEADRADEALRNALALEPAWSDLRALRAQLAHRRAGLAPSSPPPHAVGPSDHARSLFQEAEEWIDVGDPAGLGSDLLDQALADSPAYVAAAVTAYSLKGAVPEATVTALWEDGAGLWALVTGVRSVAGSRGREKDVSKEAAVDALTRPWVDRAVALDVQEARFTRALARAAAGDRAGALDDLVAYVAREPRPAHLAEARALRAGLAGGQGRLSPERLARIRLLEDRPDAALRALGGVCAPGLPADRLVAVGLVYEYADSRAAARACYEQAAAAAPDDGPTLARLARLDARLPDDELAVVARAPLERAAAHDVAAADWALARRDAASGAAAAALDGVDRALALAAKGAGAADVWIPAAREARARWAAAGRERARQARERDRLVVLGGLAAAALALGLLLRRRFGGWTLAAAVRRQPALFPDVARVVGELRHDVLKHRVGVLGLAADAHVDRVDLARALLEPKPTSAVVAAAYEHLAQAARGQGLTLRPLSREPALGALAADLARAEHLLVPRGGAFDAEGLLAIDRRLRGAHAERLTALLQQGPRTRLGAQELADWIAAVEAAARADGAAWTAPALMLRDLDVDFPVERDALHAIFANLLRNAQAAASPDGSVIVRVERERDVTGRQVVSLLVGDSAATALSLEVVESRESGRGLAIVRDLARQWRGHLVIRAEPAPFTKVVGACFPL